MASKLTDELQRMVQRSGTNTGRMRTEAERAAFATNVRKDIASIMYQLNTVYYELAQVLSSEQDLNALDKGISGNVVFTHIDATEADAEAYWSEDLVRARTIKETIDVLLAEIARLENEIQAALDADEYDDSELRSLIQGNTLDLLQLARDTMGMNYTLDGDGLQNITYSLSQRLDAIGALFAGYTTTGNTYTSTYPALSLTVLLSNVTIDTTLAQSVIAGLPDDLGYIRDFIGMDTTGPEMPTFSTYGGSLNSIADGDSLEESIWKLDQAAAASVTIQQAYDAGGAGVAGDIQLLNAKGEMQLLDDTTTPLGVLLRWVDDTSTEKGHLSDTGVVLSNSADLQIATLGADPGFIAGSGRYNVRPDATSAKAEAYYQNDNATDANAQITRDGIVKELEVGHTVVPVAGWHKASLAVGPVKVLSEYAAPSDMIVETLDYDSQDQEEAYASIPIPVDENGNVPSRVQLVGYFVLKPAAGPYPGGTGIAFGIQIPDSVAAGVVVTNSIINPGWQPTIVGTAIGLSGFSVDHMVNIVWPVQTLASSQLGLLNLKLSRLVSDAADNWDDDVGLVAVHAIWYR